MAADVFAELGDKLQPHIRPMISRVKYSPMDDQLWIEVTATPLLVCVHGYLRGVFRFDYFKNEWKFDPVQDSIFTSLDDVAQFILHDAELELHLSEYDNTVMTMYKFNSVVQTFSITGHNFIYDEFCDATLDDFTDILIERHLLVDDY